MKLATEGLLPADWHQIDAPTAQRIRRAGFSGISIIFSKPLEADLDDVQRVKQALDDAGMGVAQANGRYECLVSPDPGTRAVAIEGLRKSIRIGKVLDATVVYVRPGSLNPRGHWWPHPENHSAQTFERLVDSLKQACPLAEAEGAILAIEGHVLSPLDSPQRVLDLLQAVDSPALKFNMDPVNFVGTVRDAHDTARVINSLFDVLGSYTIAGHAKDCAVADEFVVHIDEVVPCTGRLNYDLFLRRFQTTCPDGYLLIEHLPDDMIAQARAAIAEAAVRLGIPLD